MPSLYSVFQNTETGDGKKVRHFAAGVSGGDGSGRGGRVGGRRMLVPYRDPERRQRRRCRWQRSRRRDYRRRTGPADPAAAGAVGGGTVDRVPAGAWLDG